MFTFDCRDEPFTAPVEPEVSAETPHSATPVQAQDQDDTQDTDTRTAEEITPDTAPIPWSKQNSEQRREYEREQKRKQRARAKDQQSENSGDGNAQSEPLADALDPHTVLQRQIEVLEDLAGRLDAKIVERGLSSDIRLRADVAARLAHLVERYRKLPTRTAAPRFVT
jgi:hypothetical protein